MSNPPSQPRRPSRGPRREPPRESSRDTSRESSRDREQEPPRGPSRDREQEPSRGPSRDREPPRGPSRDRPFIDSAKDSSRGGSRSPTKPVDEDTANAKTPRQRLYNIIQVRFPDSFKPIECDLGQVYADEGAKVVVQTRRGPTLAVACGQRYRKVLPTGSLQQIQRVASEADLRRDADHKVLARQALKLAIGRARELELDMKFITAEIVLDGSVLVCYFSAEGRIDFRNLVRDLSRTLSSRIEMHQVGVRNGAGSIGGIGSCGRELCCSTFLNDFEPVAIRMVKDQGLTLNPKKVSGMCGRLMCCLVYEHSAYVRGRKTLPKLGLTVRTTLGIGTVREVDIHQQSVTVLHESGEEVCFPIVEVVLSSEAPLAPQVVTIDGPVEQETQAQAEARRLRQRRPQRQGGASLAASHDTPSTSSRRDSAPPGRGREVLPPLPRRDRDRSHDRDRSREPAPPQSQAPQAVRAPSLPPPSAPVLAPTPVLAPAPDADTHPTAADTDAAEQRHRRRRGGRGRRPDDRRPDDRRSDDRRPDDRRPDDRRPDDRRPDDRRPDPRQNPRRNDDPRGNS
jgi:cell fate regulator YaaT (PSP1 superfamily)